VEIDNTVPEGHISLARILLRYEWNFVGAEREYKRAIELNPNSATAHYGYSLYLLANARSNEALAEITRGQELDPLFVRYSLGLYFTYTRQYDRAIEEYRQLFEMEPEAPVHYLLRLAFQERGMFDDAFREAQKEFAFKKYSAEEIEEINREYAASGYKGLLSAELKLEKERSKRAFIDSVELARLCALLGQKNEAFGWLAKAYEAREDGLIWLKVDPRYDNLRSDPRFSALLEQVGLQQ